MDEVALRRCESYFPGAQGRRLFRRSWAPPAPRAALVLVHGYGEHSGRYERFGAWFGARGFAVHAFDQQGHGRSEGPRFHVRRFEDLLDDLAQLLGWVRREHPDTPQFLVGHSMGGLVAAAYARERRPHLCGFVTSGAALRIGEKIPGLRLRVVRGLRLFLPRLSIDTGLDPENLCSDSEVVRAYREDPLVGSRMTASLAVEFIDASRRTAAA
ncbi:MAG: lysophospholipase, partial [Myxococcales bacterium]|nr:lysophospholipase [Myxococcales bacterium]